jgi:hypothetical protein
MFLDSTDYLALELGNVLSSELNDFKAYLLVNVLHVLIAFFLFTLIGGSYTT